PRPPAAPRQGPQVGHRVLVPPGRRPRRAERRPGGHRHGLRRAAPARRQRQAQRLPDGRKGGSEERGLTDCHPNPEDCVAERSPEPDRRSLWLRVVIVLLALVVIGFGLHIAITGVWADEGRVFAEGVPARLVGAAVAACGAVGLARTFYQWGKRR